MALTLSPDPGNHYWFSADKDRYYCHEIHGRTRKNKGLIEIFPCSSVALISKCHSV